MTTHPERGDLLQGRAERGVGEHHGRAGGLQQRPQLGRDPEPPCPRWVEGLLHLGRIGRRDEFFGTLVTADAVGEAHRLLMDAFLLPAFVRP